MDTTDSGANEGKQEMEISVVETPHPRVNLSAMEFYEKTLGAPKYVVSDYTIFAIFSRSLPLTRESLEGL